MALPVWPAELPVLVAPPGFGSDEIVPEGDMKEFDGGNIRIRRRSLVSATTRPMQLALTRMQFVVFLGFLKGDLNGSVRRFTAPIRLPSGLLGLRICQIVGKVAESDRGPYSIVSFALRVSGWDAYEPEATALFARMSTAPTALRQTQISSTIARLKYAGLWSKISLLAVYAAHATQAGRLNWIGPTFTAVLSGSPTPTFQSNRGFLGDGSQAFLDHGAGYAAIPGLSASSMTDLVWSLTDLAAGSSYDAGAADAATRQYIMGRAATGLLNVRMASSDPVLTVAVPDSLGLYGASRDGDAVSLIRNGAVIATGTMTGSTLQTGNIVSLRAGTVYSTRRLAARIVGTALTAAEHATLHGILRGYLSDIGAL